MESKLGGLFKGSLRAIEVLQTGKSPRIVRARVVGSSGSHSVSGDTLRARLGLRSTWARFTTAEPLAAVPRAAVADPETTISPAGKAEAEAELEHLRNVRRPEIVAAIKEAREFGDLSENAEYHAAREAQGLNESRIRVLEHHLATAEVRKASERRLDRRRLAGRLPRRSGRKRSEVTLVHPLEADLATASSRPRARSAGRCSAARAGEPSPLETPRGGEASSRSSRSAERSAVQPSGNGWTGIPWSVSRIPISYAAAPAHSSRCGGSALALDRQLEVGDRAVERVVLGADRVRVDPGDEVARLRRDPSVDA